jgi:hypothetical protein
MTEEENIFKKPVTGLPEESSEELEQESDLAEEIVEEPVQQDDGTVDLEDDEEIVFGDVSDTVSKSVELEDEDIEEIDGQQVSKEWYSVKKVEFLKPHLKDSQGNPIPEKPFNDTKPDGAKGWKSKAEFELDEINYAVYIPGLKWFKNVREGKVTINPSFKTDLTHAHLSKNFTAEIEKLYIRYCEKLGVKIGSVSKKNFKEDFSNYEVRLSQYFDDREEPPKPSALRIYDFRKKGTATE